MISIIMQMTLSQDFKVGGQMKEKNLIFQNQQMFIMEKFHFMKYLKEQPGIQVNIADKLNYS